MLKFKLGCDPEVLVTDVKGEFKPALDTFGGTKDFPRPMPIGDDFFVQEDNVALEFNIPPSNSSAEFTHNVRKAVNFLSEQSVDLYDLHFSTASAASFNPAHFTDIRAITFGCDPDYNAWTGKRNPKPSCKDPNLRTAGGHVHVGLGPDISFDRHGMYRLGRLMDLYLGVPAIVMDTGELRKTLYGKAGAMRVKPYGMEYRVLSNFWIFDDHLAAWVWRATEQAIEAWHDNQDVHDLEQIIVNTINNNNKVAAAEMVTHHGLLLA